MAYIIPVTIDATQPAWLTVRRGAAPLLLCMPHTGTDIPPALEARLRSPWLSRKDTDWWIDRLYDFAGDLDATVVRTSMSRTVIDPNRDPSGASLYPGQATTELCPTTTFDGEPLYRDGDTPAPAEIAARRSEYFDPYHRAVQQQIARLRVAHAAVVLYDCHSIRSQIPRLFTGTLPNFNVGTFGGASCAPALAAHIERACTVDNFSRVTNGRFKGGYTTRHYGRPQSGVHALQMELACRGYLREPAGPVDQSSWPGAWDPAFAAPMRAVLQRVLTACIDFATAAGKNDAFCRRPTQ
jgi:N-formylglutamate deformylase